LISTTQTCGANFVQQEIGRPVNLKLLTFALTTPLTEILLVALSGEWLLLGSENSMAAIRQRVGRFQFRLTPWRSQWMRSDQRLVDIQEQPVP